MKQFFRRHRRVITIVAAVLLTALVVGLIASMTSVFAKVENSNIFNSKERNKNNLVSVEDYISWDGDVHDGVEISVDENGVITLNGEAKKDTRIVLRTDTFEVPKKGYFTLSGCLDGSLDTYYLALTDLGDSTDPKGYMKEIVNTDANHTPTVVAPYKEWTFPQWDLNIVIKEGVKLNNVKIYPAVLSGVDTSFWK